MSPNPINPETAVSYAALILADEGLAVTPDKLQTLLKSADIDIEPIWSTIFAEVLKGKNVKELLTSMQLPGPVGGKVEQAQNSQADSDTGTDSDICCDGASDSGSEMGLDLFG